MGKPSSRTHWIEVMRYNVGDVLRQTPTLVNSASRHDQRHLSVVIDHDGDSIILFHLGRFIEDSADSEVDLDEYTRTLPKQTIKMFWESVSDPHGVLSDWVADIVKDNHA